MPRTFEYVIGPTGTVLTQAQVDNNILCIMDNLVGQYGWTKQAAAGCCGCFYEESNMNPGIYETSHGGDLSNLPYFPGGMGLAQWTDYPAYTATYPNPLAWAAQRDGKPWYDGNFQCYLCTMAEDPVYTDMGYGQGGRWGWQTSSSYPSISFSTFQSWTGSIEDAVKYWFYDFEWHYSSIPDWVNFPARVQWGEYAYALMQGETPQPPGPIAAGDLQGFINWCIAKCNEANIGYSQQYREEQTVGGITYYDCSSFIWYGLAHNDFNIDATGHPTYAFNTTAMPTDLPKMGWVQINPENGLKQGDIGVSATHTEVVYEAGTQEGYARFMGAHSANLPLADQVSINSYETPISDFTTYWRFGGSPGPGPGPGPGTAAARRRLWLFMRNHRINRRLIK